MSALNSWSKHHTLDIHDITTQIVHQQAISHKINAIGVDSFSHGAFRSSFPLPVLEWHFSSIINFKTHFVIIILRTISGFLAGKTRVNKQLGKKANRRTF